MDLDKLEIELTKSKYKARYYDYFVDAFAQLHPGQEYDENWHAEYLCDQLQAEFERIKIHKTPREKDIIINMPFRAAKSMITTIIFPTWCWTIAPDTKFICVSYSESLALEHADYSRDLMSGVWYQRYFGEEVVLKRGAVSFYKTTAKGFRKSVGTGGQITGSGADIIIIDDPQNPKLAASEKERKNTQDFHDHTLYSRLNQLEMGVRILVMQRLHEEDLSGHLLASAPESYQHICIPASIDLEQDRKALMPPELIKNYTNNLFWASRFSKAILLDYNKRLGEVQAAGQLQQRPAPAEGNLVKRNWFEILDPANVTRNIQNEPIDFFLDTAYTEKQENDPSGILACFKRDGILYVTNVHSVRLGFPDLVKFVIRYTEEQGYSSKSRIFIEPKASGKSLSQQLKSQTKLNVVEIEADFVKDDKKTRLSAISPIIEAGKVKLVRGVWNEEYLQQVTIFPNAKHDEYVDLTGYAINIEIPSSDFFWGFF